MRQLYKQRRDSVAQSQTLSQAANQDQSTQQIKFMYGQRLAEREDPESVSFKGSSGICQHPGVNPAASD